MTSDIYDEIIEEMWNIRRRSLEPLTSIRETEEKVVVEVDLPLVRRQDVRLRLIEGGLEIEASLTKCVRFERWGTVQRGCEFRSFYKVIPLPTSVVAEAAKASFKRGLLRVELRKRKKVEYRIPVE